MSWGAVAVESIRPSLRIQGRHIGASQPLKSIRQHPTLKAYRRAAAAAGGGPFCSLPCARAARVWVKPVVGLGVWGWAPRMMRWRWDGMMVAVVLLGFSDASELGFLRK